MWYSKQALCIRENSHISYLSLSPGGQQIQVTDRKPDARMKSGTRMAYVNNFIKQEVAVKCFKENLQLCQ